MDILSNEAKGSRTLLQLLDAKARSYPNRTYARIPKGLCIEDGFQDITFGQINKAVEAATSWLEEKHGKSTTFETLLYIGINDLRYALIFFAALKCGYKAMFISPTNALDHNIALLQDTSCSKALYSSDFAPLLDKFSSLTPGFKATEMPPWTHFLLHQPAPPSSPSFPPPPFSTSEFHPSLILHSSGSTGRPKPITLTHGALASLDRPFSPPPAGHTVGGYGNHHLLPPGTLTFTSSPVYHFTGFMAMCAQPLVCDTVPLHAPPGKGPVTPGLVKGLLEREEVKMLGASPSLIEGVWQAQGGREVLRGLETVSYSGGPLAGAVGEGLSKEGVHVVAGYGTTESGGPTVLRPDKEDWEYLFPHPAYSDVQIFEPVMDGVFEFVYREDGKQKPPLMYTYTQPAGTKEYRTKDLFTPHPTKPGLWKFYGRRDDVIVLSSGIKINPLPVELAVAGCAGVSGALVVGQGRWRTGLLIEPVEKMGHEQNRVLLGRVWDVVEKCNEGLEEGARLSKNMMAVVEPGSFLRAAKGTVVKKATSDRLVVQIEILYQSAGPECR